MHWRILLALSIPAWSQTYQVSATKDVMIPARDGVKLATDVYRPARDGSPVDGKFPTLLERTPYNKNSGANAANYYVPRGYVVVYQDVRGRYKSEGHWRRLRTILMTDSIPRSGSAHNPGRMEASAPRAVRTMALHSTRSRLPTRRI